MPTSPIVKFNFENNNVLQTTPQLGVSCLFARTTKGPKNDPSEIINSLSHFQRVFGEEIIPGKNTVSTIEKALKGGSKLRIVRVLGSDATKGFVTTNPEGFENSKSWPELYPIDGEDHDFQLSKILAFTVEKGSEWKEVYVAFRTKGYGDPIGNSDRFYFTLAYTNGSLWAKVYDSNQTLLESQQIFQAKKSIYVTDTSSEVQSFVVNASGLVDYNSLSNYMELVVVDTNKTGINTPLELKDWLEEQNGDLNKSTTITTTLYSSGITLDPSYPINYTFSYDRNSGSTTTEPDKECVWPANIGSSGSEPQLADWEGAVESILDYTDIYQVACSCINHHLSEFNVLALHKYIADILVPLQEYTYYIEVPWWKGSNKEEIMAYTDLINWVKKCIGTVGNSKYVAYFGGGIKYYDNQGTLRNSDCLGAILGLGDSCATQYGPWKSFAGMNRGVIWDGNGPVMPNYGSPSRYDQLNAIANQYTNMVIIRDTPSSGKQTMLWHLFSSQFKQDSERFLSIVRLNLYLKKMLRPIAERYLEEPNIWTTWRNMYLEAKPILDNLIDQSAISEYTWMGDQNAGSYSELTVNNEADVRQGKYKVILKYKDIVPMQEITINVVIDAASKSVSVSEEE